MHLRVDVHTYDNNHAKIWYTTQWLVRGQLVRGIFHLGYQCDGVRFESSTVIVNRQDMVRAHVTQQRIVLPHILNICKCDKMMYKGVRGVCYLSSACSHFLASSEAGVQTHQFGVQTEILVCMRDRTR